MNNIEQRINSLSILSAFQNLLLEIESDWEANEEVDWGDAESIVNELKMLPEDIISLDCMAPAGEILSYAEETEDWDCGVCGLWPSELKSAIHEVFQILQDGIEKDKTDYKIDTGFLRTMH